MGLFKQMKDMKNVLHEAPEMIAQAQALGAQAQQLQAAQAQAGGIPTMASLGTPPTAAELEPIAGISLERYAQLAKAVGTRQLQGDGLDAFLGAHGHSGADWQAAYDGWNARMKANMALSTRFGSLYQTAAAL
jgi:hypothetical protein